MLLHGESGCGGRLVVVLLAVVVVTGAGTATVVVERERRRENAHRMVRVWGCLARTGGWRIELIIERAHHSGAAVLVVRLHVLLLLLVLVLQTVRRVHVGVGRGRRRTGHLRRRRPAARLCHDGLLLGHELGQVYGIERRYGGAQVWTNEAVGRVTVERVQGRVVARREVRHREVCREI